MTAQNRAALYGYFQTGDKPTQAEFANLIDSFPSILGDTMQGPLILDANPSAALGAATKQYVDAAIAVVSAAVMPPFTDTSPLVKGSADPTKLVRFEVDGLTTGTTRIVTVPNADGTIAYLASPTFTGTPAAPTASPGTNSTQLATTAYADAIAALKANLASPTFTGTPAAPTASVGTATTQLATTAFVNAAHTVVSNSLGADVNLNNTANYFDGPTCAQGTSGTWFASGQVTVTDTGGAAVIIAKLWDGTTVIDSAVMDVRTANVVMSIPLSGVLSSPAANIKISCRDASNTTGVIKFNASGNSKDSTLTVVRLA